MMAVRGHHTHPDLVDSVRHEMSLLRVTVIKDDSCWEERIKCVIRLFLTATKEGKTSPVVMENITLPCLKILHELVRPAVQLNSSNPHQILAEDPTKKPDQEMASVFGTVDVEQVSSRQLLILYVCYIHRNRTHRTLIRKRWCCIGFSAGPVSLSGQAGQRGIFNPDAMHIVT